MILTLHLARKFFKAFMICAAVSCSIFFIFSLIGNLGEKLSFKTIVFLSTLNSFQIFTYIPSHLFILSLGLFVFSLKSQNELIIIKEYIELTRLFLIISPILSLFIYAEIKKDNLSNTIELIKSNVINSDKNGDTKVFISLEGNKKIYTILSGFYEDNSVLDQYLSFESLNQKINRGEISTDLFIKGKDLFSNKSIVYEKNNFQYKNFNKKLFENFVSFWNKNTGKIINFKVNNINSNYYFIQSILFSSLFYLCIIMIFFSKKLVDRNLSITKIFLLVLSIFLYNLLITKIILNNFEYLFHFISIMILVLTFFNIKKYE
jgi:hypothetical protein